VTLLSQARTQPSSLERPGPAAGLLPGCALVCRVREGIAGGCGWVWLGLMWSACVAAAVLYKETIKREVVVVSQTKIG